ncbi:single-stranded-DNA-specific exonuclease RecJ [Singulisphaera sp. Ch08]|uniref:Single-stranded-DNA-specific exonuclease RecJ n=1 Tax=Singulisphaera sp. Ch08 TaxID=3120278 RepID=A0AAU7CRI6_9BACT
MSTRWRLRPHDPDRTATLGRDAGIPPLVAQLLLNRGIEEPTLALAFLESRLSSLHDPELLPGVVEAADRIIRAVRAHKKIVIYGDYDVDGVCGTSILWDCLRLAGAKHLDYYIPHRVDEGYGVNADALRKLATELRAELIVTVDCGISAVSEARLARELGVEFIVTDHHTIGSELPEADVIVHPRLEDSLYPFGDLCGAAVAFKLAWQIAKGFGDGKKASPHLRDFLVQSLSLVAMATVADVVPLNGENRILVRRGLIGMFAEPTAGIRALMEVSGCLGKRKLTAGNIGFNMGPRINAAGRLERAMKAVEMLTTDDLELARKIAEELDQCNKDRQELEHKIVTEAHQMITEQGGLGTRGAIVLGRVGWHPGVIGIVASRLAEVYHRPTIVVALGDEMGQGSARSIPGLDLYKAIHQCAEGLTSFGGHAAAAGLRLPVGQLASFAERFELHCRESLTTEQLRKSLTIDAEVPLAMLSTKLVEALEMLEPHGMGNPRPLLLASGVRLLGEPRVVGERKNHLQLRLMQGSVVVKAIAWNMAERAKSLSANTLCSFVFHPSINEWNGRREVQLEVKDFQLDEASEHAQPQTA